MIPSLFIAASIRQACAVQRLQRAIRIAAPSVQIFDWTAAPGSQFFSFCSDACKSADLVVCYGHVGQEIGIQAGMAYMAGIISIRPWEAVKLVARAPASSAP